MDVYRSERGSPEHIEFGAVSRESGLDRLVSTIDTHTKFLSLHGRSYAKLSHESLSTRTLRLAQPHSRCDLNSIQAQILNVCHSTWRIYAQLSHESLSTRTLRLAQPHSRCDLNWIQARTLPLTKWQTTWGNHWFLNWSSSLSEVLALAKKVRNQVWTSCDRRATTHVLH